MQDVNPAVSVGTGSCLLLCRSYYRRLRLGLEMFGSTELLLGSSL